MNHFFRTVVRLAGEGLLFRATVRNRSIMRGRDYVSIQWRAAFTALCQ